MIDYDLIEVLDGKCLKLSSRQFVDTPLGDEDKGKISPRCFKEYKIDGSEDGGYFSTSIINSFPDVETRTLFLNKFYQCLLFGQLPHKATKLVVCGDSNSGKTSWSKFFFGLIPQTKIASISKEKTFGTSMLMDDTEFLFVDEWGLDTMSADTAKSILQGGWIVQAVKHQKPRTLNVKSGMYLTCNELPDFGEDQQHIDKRISVFRTKSLVHKIPDAPKWIEENPMKCLVYIINEINSNVQLLPENERFYEKRFDECTKAYGTTVMPREDLEKLKNFDFPCIDMQDYALEVEKGLNTTFTDIPIEESHLNDHDNGDLAGPSGINVRRSLTVETTSVTSNTLLHVAHLECK